MKAVLIGNYGVANLGDEALRDYFLKSFPEVQWTVLSAHPRGGELPRLPAGFRSFLKLNWFGTLKAMKKSDAVVFGGGSLFTDVESSLACFLWFVHAFTAWIFRVPYFLAFQGVGPFKTFWGRGLSRWVFRHAEFVSVRDHFSYGQTQEFHMHTKVIQTFDPVILAVQNSKSQRVQKEIVLIPRHNTGIAFFEAIQSALRQFPSHPVKIVSMQPDDVEEKKVCAQIHDAVPGLVGLAAVRTLDELSSALEGAAVVVSGRYHGALAALALHLPLIIIPQASGDKLSSLLPYAEGRESIGQAMESTERGQEELRTALLSVTQKKAAV